jgi:multiple sugar transport system permease protein
MTTLEVPGSRPSTKSLKRYLPVLRKSVGLTLLAALAFAFLIPILWMTVMSFQEGGKMFDLRTEWIPSVWHFENYPNALSRAPFTQYFINSGIVSLTVMATNVVFCTLAGYGLAKFRFPGLTQ